MLRFAAIGGALLIGCALAMPAEADVTPKPVQVKPGCNCPPVVHRRVDVREHRRFVARPAGGRREGPGLEKFLIPSPYEPAHYRCMVYPFGNAVVAGLSAPRAQ